MKTLKFHVASSARNPLHHTADYSLGAMGCHCFSRIIRFTMKSLQNALCSLFDQLLVIIHLKAGRSLAKFI